MKLGVVILAAGMGKRMRSDLPKVLHPLAGKPLLAHVLDAATRIGAARTVVVYGHGGEQVRTAMAARGLRLGRAGGALGTGHAVDAGDARSSRRWTGSWSSTAMCPWCDPETLRPPDRGEPGHRPGYPHRHHGRSDRLRPHRPRPRGPHPAQRRAERRDSRRSLAIREVNTGFLVADRARLDGWLGRLTNANAQGEYYLTDVDRSGRGGRGAGGERPPGRPSRRSRGSTTAPSLRSWSASTSAGWPRP